jgi:hypothetical protein
MSNVTVVRCARAVRGYARTTAPGSKVKLKVVDVAMGRRMAANVAVASCTPTAFFPPPPNGTRAECRGIGWVAQWRGIAVLIPPPRPARPFRTHLASNTGANSVACTVHCRACRRASSTAIMLYCQARESFAKSCSHLAFFSCDETIIIYVAYTSP